MNLEGDKVLKKFIVINGAMGVGKTSICKELNKKLVNSAWLDGDWCMMMNPMSFTEINQKMFLDNIYHLLNNYLSNPSFEYVLFSWVIPSEEMINYMIKKLSANHFKLVRITLLCEDNKLKERMLQAGRDEVTIEKSMLYQEAFRSINTIKINTTDLSVLDTVNKVLSNIREEDYMLLTVKRKDFEALDDISLIWKCIEPTILKIRGKNFAIKLEAYLQLNDGQKALLMFQVLYGHTLYGVEQFFSHFSYLLTNKGMWTPLKNGMLYFGAHEMVQLLDEMNTMYDNSKPEEFDQIEKDTPLFSELGRLNTLLNKILPSTIILVGSYIRSNPEQFVQFTD